VCDVSSRPVISLKTSRIKSEYAAMFDKNHGALPAHIMVRHGMFNEPTFQELSGLVFRGGHLSLQQLVMPPPGPHTCALCPLPIYDLPMTCPNTFCKAFMHILCLASALLEGDFVHVIPFSGKCRACGGEIFWGDAVRIYGLRKSILG
jgi:hypothetical protein